MRASVLWQLFGLEPESPLATRVRDSPRSDATDRLPCKEDAEAFFAAHESNPLFTTKETS